MPTDTQLGTPWKLEMDETVTIRNAGGSRLLTVGMRQSENFLQLSRTQYRYMVRAVNNYQAAIDAMIRIAHGPNSSD